MPSTMAVSYGLSAIAKANYLLQRTHGLLLIFHWLLQLPILFPSPVAHCPLPISYFLLYLSHFIFTLPTAHYPLLLHISYHTLPLTKTHCLLHTTKIYISTLHIIHFPLPVSNHSLHFIYHGTLNIAYYQ